MGLASSLSGLTAAATAIDIVGNNIANSQTIGYKASKARFADVLAASLPGAAQASTASAGVTVTVVIQPGQGSVEQSDNALDMAIAGKGFFRLNNSGAITYTRDGQFQLAYDTAIPDRRFLVNQQGRSVTGYLATYTVDPQGVIVPGAAPQDIVIDPIMPPKATTQVSMGANLDARAAVPLLPFDPLDKSTYNAAPGLAAFDSAGASHDFQMFLVKSAPGNLWDLYTTVDGGAQTGPVSVSFDTAGRMTTPMPLAAQTYALAGGASLSLAIDLSGTTQYGRSFGVDSLTQDGYPEGAIVSNNGFSVGTDGIIQAAYSNGQSRRVAQVVLANFINPDAMIGLGDGQWEANPDPVSGTGPEILDTPGNGLGGKGMGSVQGNAKETSNVDLSNELVALIEQQRNYQASAQTFKILDQVLQNLTRMTS
jgi:flagellar hook protein FlgE